MDDAHLQPKPHSTVQMPVYDANMQRFARGQHRRAIDLANKATVLATAKLAGPLGGWVTQPRPKQGAVRAPAPAGAAQYSPGQPSHAVTVQHYTVAAPALGMFPAQPGSSASFPALPSQQEFAAALAPGPRQAPAASEPYDPLRHGSMPQMLNSGGHFQFAAGTAQSMPAMQPVSFPQAQMGMRAPPPQAGHAQQAPATRESAEQAAAHFLHSLGEQQPTTQQGQGAAANGPTQPASQAAVSQIGPDGQLASTLAANAPANGVKGPDAQSPALADVIVWRRGQWIGPSPREHLLEWSLKHTVSAPPFP